MRILLTGGTGFIGRRLCALLQESGYKLIVYSRDPEKVVKACGPQVQPVAAITPEAIGAPVDAIINLAGEPIADKRWTPPQKNLILSSRLNITRDVVQLIRQQNPVPSVLISSSAVGFYGNQGDRKVTETTPPIDEFTHQICRQWEGAALEAAESGCRVCIIRTGLVLDEGGGMLSKMVPAFKAGMGGHLGTGNQWMSWIHREDLVGIFALLLNRKDLSGTFNGTAPNPATNREFTRTLAKALHRPALVPMPAIALKLMLGEMSHLLLTGQRVLPARLLNEGFTFRYPSLAKALDAIYHHTG